MIHVCFALYDKIGTYSRLTGTAMLSLFENTDSKVTVHLFHDNTLTNGNREKFIQIANRYGQLLKFYNVEELCANKLTEIKELFPEIETAHFSIATFFRFFITPLLLPQGIEKAIYLDSDIIVNLDINDFWQVNLGDKPLGVVPEIDNGVPVKKAAPLVRESMVKEEDLFNAGILLMNLRVLRNKESTIQAGMKFIGEHPQFEFFDQDVLNYCFAASALKLPIKFNFYVKWARLNGKLDVDKKLLHYADNRFGLGMDINDPYNQVFMKYFIKTPWFDIDNKATLSGANPPSRKNYAISVIIPMYNAEEYIDECLDSLLIQTFEDFEVIVVDDCSTDSSCAIVEDYAPKFNGRLKLVKLEKNSGEGGYVPRNTGLMLARGEYIQFLDADGMLLATALEALYMAANLYDADIVYNGSYYMLKDMNDAYLHRDGTSKKTIYHLNDGTGRKIIGVQKEFTMDDPSKNLTQLLLNPGEDNFHASWTKFVRRDFLLQNKIFFPNISNTGDFIWDINLYCHARRFLRIETPLYFHRFYNANSTIRAIQTPQEQCRFWFSSFINFANFLCKLERENEVLAENPNYCLSALKGQVWWVLNQTEEARNNLEIKEIYKILHSEFAKSPDDSLAGLLPFLFSFIDTEKKFNGYYSEPLDKFKSYFTVRIDIKLLSTAGDFQILSLSDKNASVSKPSWFQKGGVGYSIQSYTGNLNFIAKASVDGKVLLDLRGIDVCDPDDKAKRIPYWIDYTKLIVNGKTVFDTVTSAWHDKSFNYNLDVEADEEIVVEVEWLPHRSDTVAIAAPAPEKVAETKKLNAAIESLSTKTTELQRDNADLTQTVESLSTKTAELQDNNAKLAQTVENLSKQTTELQRNNSDLAQIINKFAPYFTARIDVKLVTSTGDFQILSLSDESAEVSKPAWFNKDGIGYAITSHVGNLKITAKATADGQIQLYLRSRDVRDPEDRSKHIPQWIDYTELTVNGLTILNELTPAWHDKPYRYNVEVKADEEINIEVDWLPHTINT